MQEVTLVTVFLAGLFGSTHCVAMCGGIAMALGSSAPGSSRRLQQLLYHTGRIFSYGIVGALAGTLGLAAGFSMEAQRWGALLRLITALFIVLIGLNLALGAHARPRWLRAPEQAGAWLWRRIAPVARSVCASRSSLRALPLGMLWGWLPCGLVYSTLIAAAASGSLLRGAEVMIAFGLGTLPAMLGLSFALVPLPRRGGAFARVLGALIVACGLWTAVVPLSDLTGRHPMHHHAMAGM